MYIICPLFDFYFSINPYLMTSFSFLVGYRFLGLLFRVGSGNGIVLSQISSFLSLISVVWLFFIGSICLSLTFKLIRTLYMLQLILSTIFTCCNFSYDPYLFTMIWSIGNKVYDDKLLSLGFELTSNVSCGSIKSILVLMFLPINISAIVWFVTVWGVHL